MAVVQTQRYFPSGFADVDGANKSKRKCEKRNNETDDL